MDKNPFYDQQQSVFISSFINANFGTKLYSDSTQENMTNMTNMTIMNTTPSQNFSYVTATHKVATAVQQVQDLNFYHFTPIDNNFYYVACKILLQEDSVSLNHHDYNHGFFYQCPYDLNIRYYVTCKLLSYPSLEIILNREICGMNFGVNDVQCAGLLTLHQKFNLEQGLKWKLSYLMRNRMSDKIVENYISNTQIVTIANISPNYNENENRYYTSNGGYLNH